MEDCVFCKISKGEIKTEFIYENDNFFAIKDLHPKVKGHSLVISKKHYETALDLPSLLGKDLMDCIKGTALKMIEAENASGFNVVNNNKESAGQVVKHFHLHILPRKKGDGFNINL